MAPDTFATEAEIGASYVLPLESFARGGYKNTDVYIMQPASHLYRQEGFKVGASSRPPGPHELLAYLRERPSLPDYAAFTSHCRTRSLAFL